MKYHRYEMKYFGIEKRACCSLSFLDSQSSYPMVVQDLRCPTQQQQLYPQLQYHSVSSDISSLLKYHLNFMIEDMQITSKFILLCCSQMQQSEKENKFSKEHSHALPNLYCFYHFMESTSIIKGAKDQKLHISLNYTNFTSNFFKYSKISEQFTDMI